MEPHPALAPLSWLIGVWKSIEAEVAYPTIEGFKYNEVLDIRPTTDQPYLEYKSDTWHSETKCKMHCERGFLRVDPKDGSLALMMAHHFGLAEVSEGSINKDGKELRLESKSLYTCPNVVATVKLIREFKMEGDELNITVSMATTSQPLQQHLQIRYKKTE